MNRHAEGEGQGDAGIVSCEFKYTQWVGGVRARGPLRAWKTLICSLQSLSRTVEVPGEFEERAVIPLPFGQQPSRGRWVRVEGVCRGSCCPSRGP